MYGLISDKHLKDIAIAVCDCLGHGANTNAVDLLLETAGAETGRGQVKDYSVYAGMGITQIDELPFKDIKDRCRSSDKALIMHHLDIDIDLVEWTHLRYNPLLSLIFTRLKYKKVPEMIPLTVEGRSEYWKEHYNSTEGKGTLAHYIDANTTYTA